MFLFVIQQYPFMSDSPALGLVLAITQRTIRGTGVQDACAPGCLRAIFKPQ